MGQTDLVSLVLAHSLQTGEVTTKMAEYADIAAMRRGTSLPLDWHQPPLHR